MMLKFNSSNLCNPFCVIDIYLAQGEIFYFTYLTYWVEKLPVGDHSVNIRLTSHTI